MSEYFDDKLIDYEIILKKLIGVLTSGNEWFTVFKCFECNKIYLFDREDETLFPDPKNLHILRFWSEPICIACGVNFKGHIVFGEKAKNKFRVTWDEINSSDWKWIIKVKEDE